MTDRALTAAKILKSVHYFTVATVCDNGTPWNTPVSGSFTDDLEFNWGSSPGNIHSQNIRINSHVFVVVYDTGAPEGERVGVYLQGTAEELEWETAAVKKYRFVPTAVWINDEAKHDDGTYKHDIRLDIDLEELKAALKSLVR